MIELEVRFSDRKVLIDDGDFSVLRGYNLHVNTNGESIYAGSRPVAVVIMGAAPLGYEWDHADRNTYNNQRSNLRLATRAQNRANIGKFKGHFSSKYKGVTWDKWAQKWKASITIDRRLKNLGRFIVEEDAARAYDAAALEVWGEFAVLNLP